MAQSIKQKFGNCKGRLTRARDFVNSMPVDTTLEMLEIRLINVKETWSEFSELYFVIIEQASDEETISFENEYSDYELRFFEANSKLITAIRAKKSLLDATTKEQSSAVEKLALQQSVLLETLCKNSENVDVKLPTFTVPIFSGDYKDWPSFRDSFQGSVDNRSSLTATQKFHYLKSFLRDEAANLIKHMVISESNYLEAWDRLERRYNRAHLIVQSFVQTFLTLPPSIAGNVKTLRKLTDGADEVIRGLNALDSNDRDPWLIVLLLNKIDHDTKQAWADHVGSRDNVAFTELLDFLESKCAALESCQSLNQASSSRSKNLGQIRTHVAESALSKQCPKCHEPHLLSQCSQFVALDVESRRSFVKNNSVCFNCLRNGHSSNKCRSNFRCRQCRSRHHSLVHPSEHSHSVNQLSQNIACRQTGSSRPQSSSSLPIVNNHVADFGLSKQTILPTILAKVENNLGQLIDCTILLDSGSQNTLVTESFAQKLGLQRESAKIPIRGVSETNAGHTRGRISMKLISRFDQNPLFIDAYVLSNLTSNLPSQTFDPSSWSHIRKLNLADPNFNIQKRIDILIGSDKMWSLVKGEQIQGPAGVPVARNTSFGWVVTGELLNPLLESHHSISSFHAALDVDALLQRFWELEEVSQPNIESCCNDEAERHFQKTFSRSFDGRYVVQLPFKNSSPVFGDSLKPAINRLHSMERRFQRDDNLRKMYLEFMREYLDLGHMIRIPSSEIETIPGKHFYLPHHAVLKADKLRVVFDGSARDSFGNSLNSQLLIGPPIQRDLVGVCLRFRQHKYVFTADIVKMFRQIWVDEKDCDFQRIVWRENPTEEIAHFRLLTVTYGTASAPFLSVRVLEQISTDYQHQYPCASRVLKEDTYVDDLMTGADTVEELIGLQTEVVALLSNAQLALRKWTSNCWPLLSRLPKDCCEFSSFDTDRSKSMVKVLGLHWNPTADEFSFKMSEPPSCSMPTRRSLLSNISRIFDPLGFLAPSVILFKVLFQELWSSELKLGWDDPLPIDLGEKWKNYEKELHHFERIRVPRNVFASLEEIELHGFSDASTIAYAAVVYVRTKSAGNLYKTTMVAAKTKVAPLKPVSIPRLELCGALLLSRLITLVKSSIPKNYRIFAWCDSQIVLHWLSSPPRRWTTFIANRTAAILETIPRYAWNHIASEYNPADCATRGVLPSELIKHPIWWTGPPWLSLSQDLWPTSKFSVPPPDEGVISREERKPLNQSLLTSCDSGSLQQLINKTSSWSRLVRIFAYCLRFISNCRSKKLAKEYSGIISLTELKFSKINILKHVQQQTFGSEIRYLVTHRNLPKGSKLIRYSPFVDNDGLLRVGGRIKNADVSYNIKHPIIIPNCHVSLLIATDIHKKNLHPGVSETFAIIRQQYWILGSRNLIRKIVHTCKPCFLQRKSTSSQLMGNLPQQRVHQSRPFANTGCDYAGPFTIKLSRGRNPKFSKAYLALFVCMCTKAIHLELVSDLTTDAFLAAFRRFVARRGRCSNVYSDNGTNFHGARRCLNEMQKLVLSQTYNDDIAASLATDGTEWHFIPPSAPHFGGLWEAGVKSVKFHLRRVIGSSILTFEELYTVLTQIECILNSRPLCVLSDEDCNPLTPAHFLIGEPYTAVPEPSYLDTSTNRLSHWNHLQSMVQGFWKRWHSEYITTLQERPKWQSPQKELKQGDIVIIKEPNLPPTKWLLGRIEATHPGPDNYVRVATIKTARGKFTRPITKLALLPIS